MSHDAHSHGPAGYDKKEVNIPMVLWISAGIALLVVVSIIFVSQYVNYQAEKAAYEIRLKPDNPQLLELRAHEESELAAVKLLDTAKGVYQIPIDRAIDLTLEQYKSDQKTPVSNEGATR